MSLCEKINPALHSLGLFRSASGTFDCRPAIRACIHCMAFHICRLHGGIETHCQSLLKYLNPPKDHWSGVHPVIVGTTLLIVIGGILCIAASAPTRRPLLHRLSWPCEDFGVDPTPCSPLSPWCFPRRVGRQVDGTLPSFSSDFSTGRRNLLWVSLATLSLA